MAAIVLLMLLLPFFVCGLNAWLNRLPGADTHLTPFKAGAVALLSFVPASMLIQLTTFGASPDELLAGIIFTSLYGVCVVFFNWFVFALSEASMHIRILTVIHQSGSTTVKQLQQQFNKDTIIAYRVPKLISVGQLGIEDGRLVVKSHLVIRFAAVLRFIRRLLAIPARPELAEHSYDSSPLTSSGSKTSPDSDSFNAQRWRSYLWRLALFAALAHGLLLFCDYRIWDGWIIENIRQHSLWAGALEHYSQAGIQHHYFIHRFVNLFSPGTFTYKALSLIAYVVAALAACDVLVRSKILRMEESLMFGFICLSFPAMKTLGEAAVLPYVSGYALFFVASSLAVRAVQERAITAALLRILSILVFLLSFTFYAMLVYFAAFFALLIFVRYQYCSGRNPARLFRAVLGATDYAFLPPLFWLFKITSMSTYGFYKEYNQPKLSSEILTVALPNFFREAILRPFFDFPAGMWPILAFVLLAATCGMIMFPARAPSRRDKSLLLIPLGLGLVVLGALPFFLVGRFLFDYTGYDSNNYTLLAPVGVGVTMVGIFGVIKSCLGERLGPKVVRVSLALLVAQFIFVWNNQRLHYQARSAKEHAFCQELAASPEMKNVSVVVVQDRYPTPRTDPLYPLSVVTSMIQAETGDRSKLAFFLPNQSSISETRIPRDFGELGLASRQASGFRIRKEDLDSMLIRTTIPFQFPQVRTDGPQVVMVIYPGVKMSEQKLALKYLMAKFFPASPDTMSFFLGRVLEIDGFLLQPPLPPIP